MNYAELPKIRVNLPAGLTNLRRYGKVSQFVLDLFFSIIFAALLILLYTLREKFFFKNRTSYRYSCAGLTVLCGVAIIQMAGHLGVLDGVPLIGEELYRNIIEAIGIVSGVTLLLAGVSFWLPGESFEDLSAEHDTGKEFYPREIREVILNSKGPDELFTKTFEKTCRMYGFSGYILLRYFSTRSKPVFISCNSLNQALVNALKNETINWENGIGEIERLKHDLGFNSAIPMYVSNKLKGAVFFHGESEKQFGEAESHQLELIGNAVTRRLEEFASLIRKEYNDGCWQNLRRLTRLVALKTDIRDQLRGIYDVFHEALGAEYFSLDIIDESRSYNRRYSVGINGTILLNQATLPADNQSHLATVIKEGRSLVIDNISCPRKLPVDSLILSCAQVSMMAIPLYRGGRIAGVVTIGSPREANFNRRKQFASRLFCYALLPIVSIDSSRLIRQKALAYNDLINSFARQMSEAYSRNDILERAARLIIDNTGTAMVRIHGFAQSEMRLRTVAVETRRPMAIADSEEIRVSARTTPLYWTAAMERRLISIRVDDENQPRYEAELKECDLDGMKSVLLVPVLVNGFTEAIITLADMRTDGRNIIDSADITFLQSLAEIIGMAFKIENISRRLVEFTLEERPVEGPKRLKLQLGRNIDPERIDLPFSQLDFSRKTISGLRDSIEESRLNIGKLVEMSEVKST